MNHRQALRGCLVHGMMAWMLLSAANLVAEVEFQTEPLVVEYGGCATVLVGPRCVLKSDRKLKLWVQADPKANIQLGDDRTEFVVLREQAILGGLLYEVEVPTQSPSIQIRVSGDDGNLATWTLNLANDEPAPSYLGEIKRLFNAGKYEETEQFLSVQLADPDLPRLGEAHRLAGIFFQNQNRAAEAKDHYRQAIDWHLSSGRTLDARWAASALSFLLKGQTESGNLSAAREVFDAFPSTEKLSSEEQYLTAYHLGLVAFDSGDARRALANFANAGELATRMGGDGRWHRRRLHAEEMLASQLQRIGRWDDANRYFSRWRAEGLPESSRRCERARSLTNFGWANILQLEAGRQAPNPIAVFEEANAVFQAHCEPLDRVNGELNIALAHFHAGKLDLSERALRQAYAATEKISRRLQFWALDLEARLAHSRGELDSAIDLLQEMETLAEVTLSPDALWRAKARRGAVLESQGDIEQAISTYGAASRQLRDNLSNIPFYAGRANLVATREWATRREIALLLGLGRSEDIAQAIRIAHRQALGGLHTATDQLSPTAQRERETAFSEYVRVRGQTYAELDAQWRRHSEENFALLVARATDRNKKLREFLDRSIHQTTQPTAWDFSAPRTGELLVAFHPLEHGWAAVAQTNGETSAKGPICAKAPSAGELAQCLLKPFHNLISQATRLVVIPTHELRGVDFHALPFGEGIILDRLPVVYSLDIGDDREVSSTGYRALVVGDATQQLRESRAEAATVEKVLSSTGVWSFDTLIGRDASYGAVRSRMEKADLFHFTGHATFDGRGRWASALALARNSEFPVSEAMSLATAPSAVVLSACNTSRSAESQAGDVIGIGQAFVLRGSQMVVATSRPVRDHTAHLLMREFYPLWQGGLPPDRALQKAQLILRERDKQRDWAAYRLLVP